MIEIIQSNFSDCDGIKVENNNNKDKYKISNFLEFKQLTTLNNVQSTRTSRYLKMNNNKSGMSKLDSSC